MLTFSADCQMLHVCPFLLMDSLDAGCFIFIHAQSNYPHLAFPNILVAYEKVLVLLHGWLAGSAPSCPEINNENLTWPVIKRDPFVTSKSLDVVERNELITFLLSKQKFEFSNAFGCCFWLHWMFLVQFLLQSSQLLNFLMGSCS